MQFKRLPDPKDREVLQDFLWGPDTIVVHDRAECVAYARHLAPLSVKATLRGGERYNVHGFFEEVRPGEHLVINGGQAYESEIDADRPIESLCVFFSARDVADAGAMCTLEWEETAPTKLVEFPAIKRRSNQRVEALLSGLLALREAPALERQAHALHLMHSLIAQEHGAFRGVALHAQRRGTRQEIYRRCLIGLAYIDAHYGEDVSLVQAASAAGLSRAYFLRCFRQCFGETPYQALARRRLDQAAAMLKRRNANVSEVAVSVGYSNFSAFSRAFRRRFGVTPSDYAV
jgi:AraC-like DNA-binding protein